MGLMRVIGEGGDSFGVDGGSGASDAMEWNGRTCKRVGFRHNVC